MSSHGHLTSKEKNRLPNELLVMYRQRSELTQVQLATLLGLKGERMVQLWEGGYYLPKASRLKKLIEVYLDRGVFVAGQEREEARELWKAVKDLADANSSNFETYPIFDEGWFASLMLTQKKAPANDDKSALSGQEIALAGQKPENDLRVIKEPVPVSNNLPAPTNLFVGRSVEIEAIGKLLGERDLRLVTLTGPGGIGKTRLALEVARQLVPSFQDGIWLVELAPHSDPYLIPQLLAKALGLEEEFGYSMAQTVRDYLQSKELLLVLDNCEHLVEECAHLAEEWLRTSSKLRILATSREALELDSECLWQVKPLPVEPPGEVNSPGSQEEAEAVRLFLARAKAIAPTFSPGKEEIVTITRICNLLEGLPLAIELAAARIKILSTAQILERLSGAVEERFELLGGNRRSSAPRHQTLIASLEWSYSLLPERERCLFRRLSVFAGSWSLEAAGVVGNEGQVLAPLTRLVDKSLVEVVNVNHEKGGSKRYRMLETVREYAHIKLVEAGEFEAARDNHLDFFLTLAEEIEPVTGEGKSGWFSRLEAEYPNFRAALSWALDRESQGAQKAPGEKSGVAESILAHHSQNIQKALRLSSALHRFWETGELVTEGRKWLARALEASPEDPEEAADTRVKAKALKVMGTLTSLQGEPQTGLKYLEASLNLYRRLQDRQEIATILSSLGTAAWMRGDDRRAIIFTEEAVALYRELGDLAALGSALNVLGSSLTYMGKAAKAETHLKEALALNRSLNHFANLAINIFELGLLAWTQGNFQSAREYLEESLAIRRELGSKLGMGGSLLFLGMLSWSEGNYQQAIKLLEEGTVLMKNWRIFFAAGSYPLYLGLAYMDQGDLDKAKEYFEESLNLSLKTDHWRDIAAALEGQVFLLLRSGRAEEAARLFGAARALRERIDFPVFPVLAERYGRELATLQNHLSREKFEHELEEGRRLGLNAINIYTKPATESNQNSP
ncbi:MAG TPA: tetratricopeptide repeat protein [Chloroflexia bacterium]|nr:tetratricopeptide repeat protein [Chloroflexia bacterium]